MAAGNAPLLPADGLYGVRRRREDVPQASPSSTKPASATTGMPTEEVSDTCTGSSSLLQHQMPVDMRETYILSGYRPPCAGLVYGMRSAFTLHNETLNVWTHGVPLLYFIYYMAWDSDVWSRLSQAGLSPLQKYPFYGYWAGLCILFGTSSLAHLLNCAWSRCWRNVCFVLDYAAITVFGVSSAIVYYFFTRPHSEVASMGGANHYVGMTAGTAILAMWACCYTRIRPHPLCHAIRVAAFAMPFLIGSTPAFARYLTAVYNSTGTSPTHGGPLPHAYPNLNHTLLPSHPALQYDHPDLLFRDRFPRHFLLMVSGSVINAIKVPERFSPGRFDLVGHSHQWFHIFIFLGIREHFWLVFDDIIHPHSATRLRHTAVGITPLLTVGSLTLVSLLVTVIIVWFAFSLPPQDTADEPAKVKETDVFPNDLIHISHNPHYIGNDISKCQFSEPCKLTPASAGISCNHSNSSANEGHDKPGHKVIRHCQGKDSPQQL